MYEGFKDFAKELQAMFPLSAAQAVRLAEILDDRMKAIAEHEARDMLDREFNRGDYGW